MARKKKDATTDSTPTSSGKLYRSLAWTVLAGSWVLIAAALASYDPADWPGHAVAPHNPTPHNWVGKFGSVVAHKIYVMGGLGVWVAMAGVAAFTLVLMVGRWPRHTLLRLTGLIIMSVAVSAILGGGLMAWISPWLPEAWTSVWPLSEGGLLSLYINKELSLRFGQIGSQLILWIALVMGLVLAADELVTFIRHGAVRLFEAVMSLPIPDLGRWLGRSGRWALATSWAGISALPHLELPRRRSQPGRKSSKRNDTRKATPGRDSDDPDRQSKTAQDSSKSPVNAFDDDVVTAEIDESEEPVIEAELDDDQDDDDGVGDAPGAYLESRQAFDPDALRDKIKKLPINFAPKSKTGGKLPEMREVDLSGYQFPKLDLLEEPEGSFTQEMEQMVRDQAVELESALQQYRIEGEVVGIDSGPVITLYELRLAPGTKVARIHSVSSDLARALRAPNIRVVPNMVGKDTVGIEVPNVKKERVRIKELMTVNPDSVAKMNLPMFLGKDASGNPLNADLAAMPHMLIAGTTGSGKSVCMNSIIMSFLFTKRPDELKLVLVDPKMVEMSLFKDIPHLMCPVVTEMSKAAAILEWATTKMDERYELLAEAGVRDIAGYNNLGWETLKERFEPTSEAEEARIPKKLPYLVFVIDELADLMMTNKEVEGFIVRLAQKSRAVGMHLILATQRPQANVVTGLIKSNMPCRVSFKVASSMDSRIVLDQKGAELLLGQGDMLYLSPRTSKLMRVQGTLVDDLEIRRTVNFLKTVSQQSFEPQLVQIKSPGMCEDDNGERDPLFDQAVEVVIQSKRGSVSLLQRRLTIGYGRASRLIEEMAQAGILGEYKGSQAREVNITLDEWEAIKAQAAADAEAQGGEDDGEGSGDGEEVEEFDDDADIDGQDLE